MYHYISDPPPDADSIRRDLSVSPRDFEAQLAYLKAAGYTSITLGDLVGYLLMGNPLPPKPVLLTFDDGYIDNFLYAFPLLRQYGYSGTFFVITQLLDEHNANYMSWEQVQLMAENGMAIESHSVSHEDLRTLGAAELKWQVQASREALEAHLHKPVRFFAYPFGHYNQTIIRAVQGAGYVAAVTTEAGVQHSAAALYGLDRIRIHGGTDLVKFKQTMEYWAP